MRLLLIGDVHGLFFDLAAKIAEAQVNFQIDAVMQLGDLGLFEEAIQDFVELKSSFSIPVYAIDGNHEDHNFIHHANYKQWKENLNLHYQERGSILNLDKTIIGFIGGALHIDRPQQANKNTSNYVRSTDIEKAGHNFNHEKPSLILSHSCPAGIGIGMKSDPRLEKMIARYTKMANFDPGPSDDCGEWALTELWKKLTYRPKFWVYGHFHQFHQKTIEGTTFVALPTFDCPPLVIFDTEDQSLLFI